MVLNLRIRLHLSFILAESVYRYQKSLRLICQSAMSFCSVASSISATRLGRGAWLCWATSNVCAEQEKIKCTAMIGYESMSFVFDSGVVKSPHMLYYLPGQASYGRLGFLSSGMSSQSCSWAIFIYSREPSLHTSYRLGLFICIACSGSGPDKGQAWKRNNQQALVCFKHWSQPVDAARIECCIEWLASKGNPSSSSRSDSEIAIHHSLFAVQSAVAATR